MGQFRFKHSLNISLVCHLSENLTLQQLWRWVCVSADNGSCDRLIMITVEHAWTSRCSVIDCSSPTDSSLPWSPSRSQHSQKMSLVSVRIVVLSALLCLYLASAQRVKVLPCSKYSIRAYRMCSQVSLCSCFNVPPLVALRKGRRHPYG